MSLTDVHTGWGFAPIQYVVCDIRKTAEATKCTEQFTGAEKSDRKFVLYVPCAEAELIIWRK